MRDDGESPPGGSEAGHGLLGMRERVAVYGGHLRTGPAGTDARGGFLLQATIPLDDTAVGKPVVSSEHSGSVS